MMTNGISESTELSKEQLKQLQQRLGPYLSRLQSLEAQANATRQAINDIAGAYLEGLGMPSDLNVDLASGHLNPAVVTKS